MFESLTRYLSELDRAEGRKDWVIDQESKDATDGLMRKPLVDYERLAVDVEQAVYAFADEHPEFELTHYNDILERNGLEWDYRVMSEADVSELDGQAVMALLMGAVRAERFCDDALLDFFEDGSVRRWLLRLSEIDSASSEGANGSSR